jgi:hypothetical protein
MIVPLQPWRRTSSPGVPTSKKQGQVKGRLFMKRFCLLGAAALVFALVGVMAAQPLHEKVTANFSYPVHVEGQVLPPGQYTIVQQNKPTGAFGLLIQGNGAEIITDASTMDIIDKPAAPQTEVVLAKVGNDYYLDKIWIQGRTTGWQ